MRNYGSIYTKFWTSAEMRKLSDQAKLLAVYLLSSPHTNMLGCFRLPLGYIAEDLAWGISVVNKTLKELCEINFIRYDKSLNWLAVPQFLKWNPIENPNQAKSIVKLFEQIPEESSIFFITVEALLKHTNHLDNAFIQRLQSLADETEKSIGTCTDESQLTPLSNSVKPIKPIKPEDAAVVISMPLAGALEFPIYHEQVKQWEVLYPNVKILQELRHIRGWNLANPKKRKTKSGILKHIHYWLAKSQNQGGQTHNSQSQGRTLFDYNCAVGKQWLDNSGFYQGKEALNESK